jgi:hypothetical protein
MEIDAWRRQQPDPMPSLSEAYRRLIKKGLDAEGKPKRSEHTLLLRFKRHEGRRDGKTRA